MMPDGGVLRSQQSVLLAGQAPRLMLIIVYKSNEKGLSRKRDQSEHI